MRQIPCYFLPSHVMIIDDDQTILDNLIPCLDEQTSVYVPFQNPFKALEYVNSQVDKMDSHVSLANADEWQHVRLNFNIYDLYKKIYNPERFSQISVVIVDYHMPGLNGLEFCAKIKNPYIQCILLTGDEDEQIAIEAFNQGLIQAYIKKHEIEALDKLKKAIREAQFNYFYQLSILTTSAATFDRSATALKDPSFINLFFNLIRENNIIEYYLHEITGTFLFLDKSGNVSSLFTFLKDQLDVIAGFHDYTGSLFDSLKNYEQILCFHSQETVEIPPPSQWDRYVRPAQLLKGHQPYYYAYGSDGFDVDHQQILSFDTYAQMHSV